MHTFASRLTYVFVHSHMTVSVCECPEISPLCSTLIIFITAIWMCRVHDECATQVWLAPNRILGYASSRQERGPGWQTAPHASLSHKSTRQHSDCAHTQTSTSLKIHNCVSKFSFVFAPHFALTYQYPSLPIIIILNYSNFNYEGLLCVFS